MYSLRDHAYMNGLPNSGKLMLPPTIQNSALNKCKSLNIAGINLLTLDAVEVHWWLPVSVP